jgi:hypothetical protein
LHEIFLSKTAGDHFPPEQKLVTNNFGKRDFMQPRERFNMHSWGARDWGAGGGVGYFWFVFLVQSLPVQLAQAKNSNQEVWKPKIHASNG